MAAHLPLTQGDVVQIHDPEPHLGLIQWQYVGLQTDQCGSNPQARATIQPRSADG